MPVIYKVKIEPIPKKDAFGITWTNVGKQTDDYFEQSDFFLTPDEVERLWLTVKHQLGIGQKLFRFLEGDARHLHRALDEAAKQGEALLLQLRACKEVADWPFELLAQNHSFLLAGRVHLLRQVSDWGAEKTVSPEDRPLKLLFMACSPLDVKPELDFEREEETIFQVTEKLAIDMEVEDSGSLEGLRQQLENEVYDVVHLSGHANITATGQPYFIMEDETGARHDVFPRALWHEALIENPPRLLFLSGCRTGETPAELASVSFAQQLVEQFNLPAVLSWGRPVADDQATLAEQVLYHELSRGRDVLAEAHRARAKLFEQFEGHRHQAWPLLRLYTGGLRPGPLVEEGQSAHPKPRRLVHTYLGASKVRKLEQGFVDRRRQLQQSLRALNQNQDKVGCLLHGTGGLGKSCLAGKICERLSDHTLVIVKGIVNAITLQQALKDGFLIARDETGQKILDQDQEMPEKLARLCTTRFKEKNYLFLFDDFEQILAGAEAGQPGALMPEAAQLIQALLHYLPFAGKMTQLLITSRYTFALSEQGQDLAAERLELIPLTSFRRVEQNKKARWLPHILHYPNGEVALKLLAAGHGNPRLMEWLNALVGEMPSAEVPQLLKAVQGKKQEFVQKHVIGELLAFAGKEAAQFLRWFSVFRQPVHEDGGQRVGETAGLPGWQEHLQRAVQLRLIEHDRARDAYQITPLLRTELWAGLKKTKDRQACHEAAFAYYKQLCGSRETLDPILTEEWIYHALGCGQEEVAARQGGRLVSYLRETLAYLESRRVGEWVLEQKIQSLASEYDAYILNELGGTVDTLGEHQKAIDYFQQALEIDRAVFGDHHPNVATRLNNLGSAYLVLGKKSEAKKYFQQAYAIFLEFFGPEHPSTKMVAVWLEQVKYE